MENNILNRDFHLDGIRFKTVQYVSAVYPKLHSYLKQNGYSNHGSIFVELAPEAHNQGILSMIMLRKDGTAFLLYPNNPEAGIIPYHDRKFLIMVVCQIHDLIHEGHPYLIDTLSAMEDELGLVFGSITKKPAPLF